MTSSTTNHRNEERARRRAEATAHELLNGTLIGSAGDLGVISSERDAAELAISDAEQQAQQIRDDADKRAQELIDVARERAAAVENRYADAWRAARATGWSPAQLRGMGYRRPPRTATRDSPDDADTEQLTTTPDVVEPRHKHDESPSTVSVRQELLTDLGAEQLSQAAIGRETQ